MISFLSQINAINVRLGNARKKYYTEELGVAEYRSYKAECEGEINRLEAKLEEVADTPSQKDTELLRQQKYKCIRRIFQC